MRPGSHALYWTEKRIIGGADPIEMGKNNSGRGVGGSMVHYAGYCPRFHPSDFEIAHPRRGRRGLADRLPGAEAPLRARSSASCRSPARTGRGATRTRYPFSPHPVSGAAQAHLAGCIESSGIEMRVGAGRHHQRHVRQPAALHLPRLLPPGLQGQREGQPLRHPPARCAWRTGSRSAPTAWRCVSRSTERPAEPSGVDLHAGWRAGRAHPAAPRPSRSLATPSRRPGCCSTRPRPRFPNGVGNNDDQVGRYVMVQGAAQSAGRLPDEQRHVQGAAPRGLLRAVLRDRRDGAGFARGFSIQTVSPLPIGWAEHVLAEGHWGRALREYMRDYNHWARSASSTSSCPSRDNRVTLAEETDLAGYADRAVRPQALARTTRPTWTTRRGSSETSSSRRRPGRPHHPPLRPPDRRRPDGHRSGGQRRRRRPAGLGRPQPLPRRRQRLPYPGLGQPGAHDHGACLAPRRSTSRKQRARRHGAGAMNSSRAHDEREVTEVVVVTGPRRGRPSDRPRLRRAALASRCSPGARGPRRSARRGRVPAAGKRFPSPTTWPSSTRSRRRRSGRGAARPDRRVGQQRMATGLRPLLRHRPRGVRRATEVTYLGFVHGTMAALGAHATARDRGVIVQVGSALGLPRDPPAGRLLRREVRDQRLHRLDPHGAAPRHAATCGSRWCSCRASTRRSSTGVARSCPVIPSPCRRSISPRSRRRPSYWAAQHQARELWVGCSAVRRSSANGSRRALRRPIPGPTGYSGQQVRPADRTASGRTTCSQPSTSRRGHARHLRREGQGPAAPSCGRRPTAAPSPRARRGGRRGRARGEGTGR